MPFNSASRILITGGTGSFGRSFLAKIFNICPDVQRVVVYSRDELKQWQLQQKYPADLYPQLRFFLGDVRDRDRLRRALEGIDTVVHAAALKQVPAAEYNPMEFINTNVLGAENLVQACLDYILLLSVQIRQQLRSTYTVQLNYAPINYLFQLIILKAVAIFVFLLFVTAMLWDQGDRLYRSFWRRQKRAFCPLLTPQ